MRVFSLGLSLSLWASALYMRTSVSTYLACAPKESATDRRYWTRPNPKSTPPTGPISRASRSQGHPSIAVRQKYRLHPYHTASPASNKATAPSPRQPSNPPQKRRRTESLHAARRAENRLPGLRAQTVFSSRRHFFLRAPTSQTSIPRSAPPSIILPPRARRPRRRLAGKESSGAGRHWRPFRKTLHPLLIITATHTLLARPVISGFPLVFRKEKNKKGARLDHSAPCISS